MLNELDIACHGRGSEVPSLPTPVYPDLANIQQIISSIIARILNDQVQLPNHPKKLMSTIGKYGMSMIIVTVSYSQLTAPGSEKVISKPSDLPAPVYHSNVILSLVMLVALSPATLDGAKTVRKSSHLLCKKTS